MKVFTSNEITPLNIHFTRYGELFCSPRWSSKTGVPCSTATRLYFIEEGSGFLKTATQTLELKPGYAYLIPPFLHHEYGCTGIKKIYFIFRLQSIGKKDLLAGVDRICQIRYDPEDLKILLESYDKEDCLSALQMRMVIFKNVIRLLQESSIPSPMLNPHSDLVNKAIAYIESHVRANLTVREVSEHLYISDSKLQAAFFTETGVHIGQYIDSTVMHKGKELLQNTKLSIGEISERLKFCDQFYFCRQFKKRFGITPSQYRKSLK